MVTRLEPYPFERVYGAWFDAVVYQHGRAVVRRAVERYTRAFEGA